MRKYNHDTADAGTQVHVNDLMQRNEALEAALKTVIHAYNATPEPCHYKIREAIWAAQRLLADNATEE